MSLAHSFLHITPRCRLLNLSLVFALQCVLVLSGLAQTAQTRSITLAWDPGPSDTLVSYTIYYGTKSGAYTDRMFFGNVNSATISGLLPGVTYYFVATATDGQGLESDFSNEISYTVPLSLGPLSIYIGPDEQIWLTGVGAVGTSYNLLASEDLVEWHFISLVTTDAQGVYQFIDPASKTNHARFYLLQLPR